MNTEIELSPLADGPAASPIAAPSVNFITAISEFFETDPSDLLAELGYYNVDDDTPCPAE